MWYPELWLVLILVGVLSAGTAFAVDLASNILHNAKLEMSNLTENPYINFLIWLGYALIFGFIAVAVGEWISRDAEGSGIPE